MAGLKVHAQYTYANSRPPDKQYLRCTFELTPINAAAPRGADHAGMDTKPPADEHEQALRALTQVVDPEICENIVDLGLVERLDIAPARVTLALVFTSPTCPMGDAIADDAWRVLRALWPQREILVEEAPGIEWLPQRMSDAARQRLGWGDAAG